MCNSVEASAADREPYRKDNRHLFKCKARCCSFCSYCSRAFSKERNKSRDSKLSLQERYIKTCEKCFLCHSIVLCKSCLKCSKCCHKSACRGQTSKVLEKLVRSGCRTENGSNLERGLHPPLSDPAELVKDSHSHKLLWQSSQKPQTVRGITSAYGQKCHRTSSQKGLTRFLQPTIFSPKTGKQVETDLRPKQSEFFPQDRKIQDGDTGNHQNISPKGRMGNLCRLQGRLLPHSNTGTVQDVSQISYPGAGLPVQSTAVRSVNGSHGIHYYSKGGEADGHSQRYKDPPVPRRLVGESHIPPGLSPAYTGPNKNVPTSRLAGECRKVGAETQADFQLRRLPIRPPVRSGSTDTGPVAKPSGQNTGSDLPTGLFGKEIYVPDRATDSHRKTSSPGQTTHEAHSMASQKQLENTGILGKTDPSTQIATSSFAMVAERRQCPHRPTITPYATCSANLYRCIKRRVGCSLKRVHCQRNLVTAGKQTAYKLLGTKSSLSGSKRVPKAMHGQNGSGSNRQHHSSGLHQQGGRHEVEPTLCPTLENLDLVYRETSDSEGPTHSRPPKCSGRQAVQIGTDYSNRMVPPSRGFSNPVQQVALASDLFATRFNNKVPLFVSPVPDPMATAVDALSLSWEDLDAYAFPPTAILGKVVEKLQDSPYRRLIIIAPGWPNMTWFWDLVEMSSQVPLLLPQLPNLLTQPFNQTPHRSLTNLNLHAWLLEPQLSRSRVCLRRWQQELRLLKEDQPDPSM